MENESLPPSVIPFEIVIKPTYNMNNDIGASTIDHKKSFIHYYIFNLTKYAYVVTNKLIY
jgi:hypothetical protein